jgi:hypothetical protein
MDCAKGRIIWRAFTVITMRCDMWIGFKARRTKMAYETTTLEYLQRKYNRRVGALMGWSRDEIGKEHYSES